MPAKEVENWDEDDEFADIDESNFLLSSVSSAGSQASEGFYQRPVSASAAAIQAHSTHLANVPRGVFSKNLRNFSEADNINDDYEDDFADLTTKISRLDVKKNREGLKQSLGQIPNIDYSSITGTITGTVKHLGGNSGHYGGAFNDKWNIDDDMFMDEDEMQTIRVASGKKLSAGIDSSRRSNSSMLISGDFYKPPELACNVEKKKKKNISYDDDEFQFDDDGGENLADRFTRVKRTRQAETPGSFDDTLDDSFGFRTDSRLSTYSLTTSATSYTDNEEDADFGFSKESGELFDKPSILQKRLENVRHQNELESERDRELLSKGRKYDTIRSSGSGNSVKVNFKDDTITNRPVVDDPDDSDEDLLNGFELNGDDVLPYTKGTLHKNVIIKAANYSSRFGGKSSRRNLKAPRETQSTADFHQLGINSNGGPVDNSTIRVKQSMPVLRAPTQRSSSGRAIPITSSISPQRQPKDLQQTQESSRRISLGVTTSPSKLQLHRTSNTVGRQLLSRTQDRIEDDEFGNITIDATSTLAAKPQQEPGRRLRPVQSMLTIQPHDRQKPRTSTTRQFTRPKRGGPVFEQNVLDQFDDLNVDVEREIKFSVAPKGKVYPNQGTLKSNFIKHVPLDTYREKIPVRRVRGSELPQQHPSTARSPTKSSLLKDNSQKKRTPGKRKGLGLIRNLGDLSVLQTQETNGMHFNPAKLVWEGNDIELKKFDSVNPKTPGLIAFISNKSQQVVGDMVFDPDRLCWINTKEDHSDPFEGLDDLEVGNASQANRQLSLSTVASAAVTAAENLASSIGGEFSVGNEFNLTSKFIDKLRHEDERWSRKTKGWFSPNEDLDREYLGEIRSMVMRR